VGNRSSGKMGFAIAEAAYYAGAEVTLISGSVSVTPPYGIPLAIALTAHDMDKAVREAVKGADALVMAAAVADYAPQGVSEQKIKKTDEKLSIDLTPTADILGNLA